MHTEKEKYIEQYKQLHADNNKFPGDSTPIHTQRIAEIINRTNSKSILDYGCGKGEQYTVRRIHRIWGTAMPILYDPAVSAHNIAPNGKFDGVLCIDVMEHVPETAVDEVLCDIITYATKFVFFNISTRLAAQLLPDGQNAHCTVHEHLWWESKIKEIKKEVNPNITIIVTSTKEVTAPPTISRV